MAAFKFSTRGRLEATEQMLTRRAILCGILSIIVVISVMWALKAHAAELNDSNGNPVGLIKSLKTGKSARVSPRYAATFQAYLDDVEASGATILFVGGYRKGRCSIPASKHPCGMAIDLCQKRRGVVDPRCHLPPRAELARIAERHGLIEGGVWCSSDYGHAEIRTARQAVGCHNLYAAVAAFKHTQEATP